METTKCKRISLRFFSQDLERGYLTYSEASMLKSSRITGACAVVFFTITLALRLINYAPWAETDHDLRVINWTYGVLWSSGMCGGGVLFFLPVCSKCFSPSIREIIGGFAMCLCFIPATGAQHYMAAVHGFTLKEDTCLLEGDNFVTMPIVVGICALHMVLAVRWCIMVPSEVFTIVMYAGLSFSLSPHTRVALFNSSMLTFSVICVALGKRRLEHMERRFFLTVVNERTLRARAEFQLSKVSARTGGEEHGTAPSTLESASWFQGSNPDMSESLVMIKQIGRSEQWLVGEEELQVARTRLGEGGYGMVMIGRFHGSPVAIKTLKFEQERFFRSIGNELRILRRLRHPNIVLFHGACMNESSMDMALVLEYCSGVPLNDFVQPECSRSERYECLLGVCRAFRYLHTRSPTVVHGDLKPANVMVERRLAHSGGSFAFARLLDFGLSLKLTAHSKTKGCTPRWSAPETFQDDVWVSPSRDVYSFGLVVFFTVTGTIPFALFSGKLIRAMAARRTLPSLEWPLDCPCTCKCQDLVRAMSSLDPTDRPCMVHIHDDLVQLTEDHDAEDEEGTVPIDAPFWEALREARQACLDDARKRRVAVGQPRAAGTKRSSKFHMSL